MANLSIIAAVDWPGAQQALLAAGPELGDIIKLLVLVGAGIFWVVQHLMGEEKAAPPRPRPQPRPEAAPQDQPPLEDEIADFLRQAARRTEGVRPAEARVETMQPPVQRPQQKPKPQRPPDKKRQPDKPTRAGDRSGKRGQPRDLKERHTVEDHVRAQLDVSDFEIRSDRLGDAVESAGTDLEMRLHAKFDHQLGNLAQSGATESMTSASAGSISPVLPVVNFAAILRDPANIRQALIMQEILSPPRDRW